MKRMIAIMLILGMLSGGYAACESSGREVKAIVEELVTFYAKYGGEAEPQLEALLTELEETDLDAALRWRSILTLWEKVNADLEIHEDVLPDGLPDTDELCIVALGFQLFSDGRMRQELVERLKVVLRCAEKYPNALIVCTGGPTATDNQSVTEAGRMANWLKRNGVAAERIITEKKSRTTAQNAMYSYQILTEKYPQVKQLVIVSSDYHIATGWLLFEAEAILQAENAGQETMHVVSNAAYKAPSGSLSTMFQAGALIELAGDKKTAYQIYYNTYKIHDLPPLTADGD